MSLSFEDQKKVKIDISDVENTASLYTLATHIAESVEAEVYESYGLVPKSETLTLEQAKASEDVTTALDQTDRGRKHISKDLAIDIIQYSQCVPSHKIGAVLAKNVTDEDVRRTIGENRSIHAYAYNLLQYPYTRLKDLLQQALYNR